jgi:hypothetical protein
LLFYARDSKVIFNCDFDSGKSFEIKQKSFESLQINYSMRFIVEINRLINPINQVKPVAIYERTDIYRSFLQMFVGDERSKRRFDLPLDDRVSARLRRVKLRSEVRNMIRDFAPPIGETFRERRFDFAQFAIKTIEFGVDAEINFGKHFRRFRIEKPLDDLRH